MFIIFHVGSLQPKLTSSLKSFSRTSFGQILVEKKASIESIGGCVAHLKIKEEWELLPLEPKLRLYVQNGSLEL
jgi:hypothetical protein